MIWCWDIDSLWFKVYGLKFKDKRYEKYLFLFSDARSLQNEALSFF